METRTRVENGRRARWRGLCLGFASAVTLHNAEEWLTYRAWLDRGTAPELEAYSAGFPVALAVVTALIWVGAVSAMRRDATPFANHFIGMLALTFLINAFVPHIALALWSGRYVPGLISALLLIIPVPTLLLREALRTSRVDFRSLAVFTAIGLPFLVIFVAVVMVMIFVAMILFAA